MKLRDFRPMSKKRREKKDYYIENGVRVYKGSKVDKAIKTYRKKGYYCTEPESQEFKNCPPTLRPSIFGSTRHGKRYHHPLIREKK